MNVPLPSYPELCEKTLVGRTTLIICTVNMKLEPGDSISKNTVNNPNPDEREYVNLFWFHLSDFFLSFITHPLYL